MRYTTTQVSPRSAVGGSVFMVKHGRYLTDKRNTQVLLDPNKEAAAVNKLHLKCLDSSCTNSTRGKKEKDGY